MRGRAQLRAALPFAAVAMLAACAQAPQAPEAPPAPRYVASAAEAARDEAIKRHRDLASSARAAGDLATAKDHLQVAALLEPESPAIRKDLDATQAEIDRGVRDHLDAARTATRANDAARATSEYLKVIALDPRNADATKALREIDRLAMTRAQSSRAARVRMEDLVADQRATRGAAGAAPAAAAAVAAPADSYDIDMRIDMLRAGDTAGALRDLKTWVDAHPKDTAARQRIGAAVAERARDTENRGQKAQALSLYEQALALRGSPMAEWSTRIAALKKGASEEYYNDGVKIMRTDLPGAITRFESALKLDPQNTNAAMRLREAKAMQEKLTRVPSK